MPPCARIGISEGDLLSFGVPELWTKAVLEAGTDEYLLAIGEHLPPEAAEAVLKIAVGERPEASEPVAKPDDAGLPYRRDINKRILRCLHHFGDFDQLHRACRRVLLEDVSPKWLITFTAMRPRTASVGKAVQAQGQG